MCARAPNQKRGLTMVFTETEDFTAEVQELLRTRNFTELAARLRALESHEVIDLIDDLPIVDAAVTFRLLAKNEAWKVFDGLDSGSQTELIAELGAEELTEVFKELDPEEQAWLLDEVPAKVAKRIVGQLEPQQLARANRLLGYPSGSAGRRMSPQAVTALPEDTVAQVLSRVRRSTADMDRLSIIPVITRSRRLVGVISLLTLVRSASEEQGSPDETIGNLMDANVWAATTTDDAEIVAREALDDGILLVPVVDSENRLVGIFPISDAARIDREAVAEDHARQGGAEPLRRPYLLTSVFGVAKSRIVWLLVLAISAVLTVQVLEMYEATLAEVVALALFVPLLTGIGGNTGSQAATTVTRAIGLGDVAARDVGKVAFKEMRTGLMLGATLAVLAFAIAAPFYGPSIGAVIGLTLLVNCPTAATVGGVIPLVARACKVDPAVFSTPFISTFCDATGLVVYFTIARAVLGL